MEKPKTRGVPVSAQMLKELGGSKFDAFNYTIANQVLATLWLKNSDKDTSGAALAAMLAIKPANELESMLAAQLVTTHFSAMECYRRANHSKQTFEGRREELNQANRLIRSYAVLLEALNRNRGKGQQRVTVEHVHVNQGGQAIVGTVRGRGVELKSEEQPHARSITYEPGQTLPSEIETVREAVPSTGGQGLDRLSDARRRRRSSDR